MSAEAAHGHLARILIEGLTIANQISWAAKVDSRSPDVSSGDDTSRVLADDSWQQGEGSMVALRTKGTSAIPSGTRAAATFYEYNGWSVETSATGLGDILTVNGTDYTQAAANDVTAGEWVDAAGLVAAINNVTYGSAPAFIASASGTLVTIEAFGDILAVSKTDVGGVLTLADLSLLIAGEIKVGGSDRDKAMDTADRQEITYDFMFSGPIIDEDGNLV